MVWVVAELLQSGHYRDGAGTTGSENEDLHGSGAYARMRVNESAGDGMRREAENFWVLGVSHIVDYVIGRHCY